MTTVTHLRVNLGSGRYRLDGWTNVDLDHPADISGDFRDLAFHDLDELNMSHVLEHISWRETVPLLTQLRGWMRPRGILTIEVPDMTAILKRGTSDPHWLKCVYGDQSTRGEYHQAGFSSVSLCDAVTDAGWTVIDLDEFISDHPGREGMPCVKVWATA